MDNINKEYLLSFMKKLKENEKEIKNSLKKSKEKYDINLKKSEMIDEDFKKLEKKCKDIKNKLKN